MTAKLHWLLLLKENIEYSHAHSDITHSFCCSVSNIIYKNILHLNHKCSSDILCLTGGKASTRCHALPSAQAFLSLNSQLTMNAQSSWEQLPDWETSCSTPRCY